jgi:hypothetical protein
MADVSRDQRLNDLRSLYDLLGMLEERVGPPTPLKCLPGRSFPNRGVYFFFEPGEQRSGSGLGARVVRVGTHALRAGSKSSLKGRLSQHRGSQLGGNHRGSIFRLLIGSSLSARCSELVCQSWGVGQSAGSSVRDAERALEQLVSRVIGEMPVLVLPISDEPGPASMRGFVERNSIALLSNWDRVEIDPPSSDWLGRWCPRQRVRKSGLWNNQHVDEAYEPDFPDQLAELIALAPRQL